MEQRALLAVALVAGCVTAATGSEGAVAAGPVIWLTAR